MPCLYVGILRYTPVHAYGCVWAEDASLATFQVVSTTIVLTSTAASENSYEVLISRNIGGHTISS